MFGAGICVMSQVTQVEIKHITNQVSVSCYYYYVIIKPRPTYMSRHVFWCPSPHTSTYE